MIHVIYASVAVRPFSATEMADLLRHSREANDELAVTGMLLHVDGSFFQVLEGRAECVEPLFARIAADPRHSGVTVIIRERIRRRAFADWSMGFATMDGATLGNLAGFSTPAGTSIASSQIDGRRARKLLQAFALGRWRLRSDAAAA